MKNKIDEIIDISDIKDIFQLADLQFVLQKDGGVFISDSDDYAEYNGQQWESFKSTGSITNDMIPWKIFIEKYSNSSSTLTKEIQADVPDVKTEPLFTPQIENPADLFNTEFEPETQESLSEAKQWKERYYNLLDILNTFKEK